MPILFTTADLVDIRRYCGYPAASVVANYAPGSKGAILADVLVRVSLDTDETTVVQTIYLARLRLIEADIVDQSRDNLDAASLPGGYKHNANEVADREGLYLSWRRKLCQFLGVPTGPNLGVVIPGMFFVR